jgi:integrase/recombinase XerD
MGELTWQQVLREFETVYLPSRNLAPRTRKEYINDLQVFIDYLTQSGVQRVGEISTRHIDRYLAYLEEQGLAGATRKRKAITYRAVLALLYRQGYLSHDLSRQVIVPFAQATTPRILTQSEFQRLLQACQGQIRDTAITTLLLQTGIRLSELTRLTVDDVDIRKDGKGEVRICASGSRKGRVVPLNSKAGQALKIYLESRSYSTQPALFLNRQGKPLGNRGVEKLLGKYFAKAGIAGGYTHSLRHTFGVQHLARGTSLKTIQRVMGHQDIRTTEVYVSLAQEIAHGELEANAL